MAYHEQIITMLSISDVAWLFGIHSNTVRRWADRGIIRACRSNSRGDRRFRRRDVARLLAKLGA